MAKKKKFKAPKCPYCKEKLDFVYETIYETYNFNKKTGGYNERDLEDLTVKCPLCDTDITDMFEEGACNYQAK